MKRKWIETGQELLIILLNHLALVSVGITGMGLLRQNDHKVWLWSLLLIVPLLFYLLRIKVRKFFLFFALHLTVPVGCLFLPVRIVPKLLMVFISIVYLIWSVRIRINERGHGENLLGPVFMTVTLGVMLLIETSYSQKGWESIYVAMGIIYVAGYFMYVFTSRYLSFLVVNESSAANIPEAEIFNQGFHQSFMYMAGVVTLLVLTANVQWLSYIVSWIGSVLAKLLRLFFSGVGGGSTETEMPVTPPAEQPPLDMSGLLPEPGEPLMFLVVLGNLVRYASYLLIIGLIVFGIGKGFQHLWKGFHKDSLQDGKEINSGIDIRETCTIEKTKKEGSNWFSFLNNREKIRKIYRKQVLKNKTVIIGDLVVENLGYMTAKECCDKFAAEQLQKTYEKARYSVEEIASDDVRAAKSGDFIQDRKR